MRFGKLQLEMKFHKVATLTTLEETSKLGCSNLCPKGFKDSNASQSSRLKSSLSIWQSKSILGTQTFGFDSLIELAYFTKLSLIAASFLGSKENPPAALCPPNLANRSLQDDIASVTSKPSIERAEPLH